MDPTTNSTELHHYLELGNAPIRFESVSQLTNVFFDDSNRQVYDDQTLVYRINFNHFQLADFCRPFGRCNRNRRKKSQRQ